MRESLIFCEWKRKWAICSKKNERLTHLHICLEQPEQIAHISSFVMSDLSDLSNLLTLARLSWATWENRSHSLICPEKFEQMSKWANEQRANEQWAISKWADSQPCLKSATTNVCKNICETFNRGGGNVFLHFLKLKTERNTWSKKCCPISGPNRLKNLLKRFNFLLGDCSNYFQLFI